MNTKRDSLITFASTDFTKSVLRVSVTENPIMINLSRSVTEKRNASNLSCNLPISSPCINRSRSQSMTSGVHYSNKTDSKKRILVLKYYVLKHTLHQRTARRGMTKLQPPIVFCNNFIQLVSSNESIFCANTITA